MDEDQFKQEVQALIDRADLCQLSVSIVLEDLAEEQRAEWDDRETE